MRDQNGNPQRRRTEEQPVVSGWGDLGSADGGQFIVGRPTCNMVGVVGIEIA